MKTIDFYGDKLDVVDMDGQPGGDGTPFGRESRIGLDGTEQEVRRSHLHV